MQKRNLKKCNLLIVILLLCAQLSAHSGLLWGEKNLRVAKTKWFDIIYPARCEETAAILYEKADTVYEEVTAQYGLTPSFRMPVVITPAVEQFNAFWTSLPYNHIALYDTGSSGSSELAVFSETLLSTFRHELTHAVTYNMKNGFWRGMGAIFGDCVVPGMLSVTTGMAEGATVTSESAAGEGRLNDEYAKHYVKQAKIEDKFPNYHDVSGAADIQPGGAPYFFNGAFHQWLQDSYGLDAYADFWWRVVNGKNITISGAFKKAFGIKLKLAWSYFIDDYEVPEVAANPVRAGVVQDFFEPESDDYSELNNAGSYYASLSAGGDRLAWLDYYGSRVFTQDGKVFAQAGLTDAKLSNDGRFIAVSYMSGNAANAQARVRLYDFENKSFYSVREHGLKEAVVLKSDGGWYLIGQKYNAQHYSIAVYKLLFNSKGHRVTGVEPVSEMAFDVETNPYAFTPLSDGTFAYLKKHALSYSLCVNSVDGTLLKEYAFPQGTTVRSLSYSESDDDGSGIFYFSYAQKGTMPRLGIMDAASGQLSLSTQDISGGVFEPVVWKGKVVYIGQFLRQSRILCMNNDSDYEEEVAVTVDSEESDDEDSEIINSPISDSYVSSSVSIPSKKFNPFPYLARGVFIPLCSYTTDYFGFNANSAKTYDAYFLAGATYITANPWTNGGTDLMQVTAGYNPFTNAIGSAITITKGTSTSLFNTQTQIKSEFDPDDEGWKQSGIISAISTTFEVGRISYLSFSNQAQALIGNQKEIAFSLYDVVSAQFSNIGRAGPGRFERAGFAVAVSYGRYYDASFTDPSQALIDKSALAGAAKICIPRLLPIESKYGYTYNMPLTLDFSLFPSSSHYAYAFFGEEVADELNPKDRLGNVVFDGTVEIKAFSMDIQKAIPGITAVYLNDFYVGIGYAATGTAGSASVQGFQTAKLGEYFKAIADGRGYYLDSVYLKGGLEFTPNIGIVAKSAFKMGMYIVYSYSLRTYENVKPTEYSNITVGFDANF